jgi:hypothetical protein
VHGFYSATPAVGGGATNDKPSYGFGESNCFTRPPRCPHRAITIKVLLEIVGTISVVAQVQHASTAERTNCLGGELRRRDDQARSLGP